MLKLLIREGDHSLQETHPECTRLIASLVQKSVAHRLRISQYSVMQKGGSFENLVGRTLASNSVASQRQSCYALLKWLPTFDGIVWTIVVTMARQLYDYHGPQYTIKSDKADQQPSSHTRPRISSI